MARYFLIALLALAPLGFARSALAQSAVPIVTSSCGSQSLTATRNASPYEDTTGKLCTNGSGGTGGAVTIADGADVTLGAKADGAWNGSGSGSVVAVNKAIYGAVTSPPTPGSASGGYSETETLSLSTTVTQVFTGAHQLVGVRCDGPNSAETFVQMFDLAAAGSVTLGTTAATEHIWVINGIPNGWAPQSLVGEQFSNGLQVAYTTTAGGSTAPATAINCTWTYK